MNLLGLGEAAALGTALCWSASSVFFTFASRGVGSVVLNRTRLLVALALLSLLHTAAFGAPLPLTAESSRWIWLGLSGVVGLAIGDAFLFQAYVWIGARLTMLVMSAVPVISAGLAWIALGERLVAAQWAGVALTVGGIAAVVSERPAPNAGGPAVSPDLRRGLLFALGAAIGQAGGLILARQGLGGDFPALSGNVIRMCCAAAALWAVTLLRGQGRATAERLRGAPRAWLPILGGSFFGPTIGVWLSLLAIQHTRIGVASTIMALPPVFLLPIGRWVFGERVGLRAVAGTLVAIGGVALLVSA